MNLKVKIEAYLGLELKEILARLSRLREGRVGRESRAEVFWREGERGGRLRISCSGHFWVILGKTCKIFKNWNNKFLSRIDHLLKIFKQNLRKLFLISNYILLEIIFRYLIKNF